MGTCFSCVDTAVSVVPYFNNINEQPRILTPLEHQPHLLDLQLCQVAVMASHNSYIRTLQHLSESTTAALQTVLNRGARCIELDVYRGDGTVFVAHGKEETPDDIITTTKLDLGVAFEYLRANAFTRTSDPLFVALELNVHREEDACNQIADLIDRHFGDVVFKGVLSSQTLLRDLIGKVVFLSGGGSTGKLASYIHMNWNDIFQNFSSEILPTTIRGMGTCIRVYPAGDIAGALSANYNPIPYLMNGATFVSLNMCTNDNPMKWYMEWFAQSSFVKKPVATATGI